jgi:neutral ceramidase
MKVAAKRVNITPPIGLSIDGNVRADDKSRGVHDDLFCNAVYFCHEGQEVLFLSFDLLCLMGDQCADIKKRVSKSANIPEDRIMVNTTHTHSGPDTSEIFKSKRHEDAVDYLDKAFSSIAENLKGIKEEAQESEVFCAVTDVNDLSFNRRLIMKDNSIVMNWNKVDPDDVIGTTGPIDPTLTVIQCVSKDTSKTLALMVNFTLHPAILVGKDWLYSRDYIHYLTVKLQEHFGDETVVWFSNGAEGNINHLDYKNPDQNRGFEEAERIGKKLADYTMEALANKRRLPDHIKNAVAIIQLPCRKISEEDVKNAKALWEACGGVIPSLLDGVPDEIYAREILTLAEQNRSFIETTIQAVLLGDVLFVTFPGEVFVEFALEVKKNAKAAHTVVVGLANDYVGYIPNQEAFRQGGYEIKTAQSSKLSETAGNVLVEEILKLTYCL